MGFIKEFKEFAMKGNLIDMGVAFVMGGAFGKVVSSFIDGLIMPVVGKITAGADFKSLKYILSEAQYNNTGKIISAEASIKYGEFITVITLVALVMFLLVKAVNKAKKKNIQTLPSEPEPTADQKLLTEIRDLLKSK